MWVSTSMEDILSTISLCVSRNAPSAAPLALLPLCRLILLSLSKASQRWPLGFWPILMSLYSERFREALKLGTTSWLVQRMKIIKIAKLLCAKLKFAVSVRDWLTLFFKKANMVGIIATPAVLEKSNFLPDYTFLHTDAHTQRSSWRWIGDDVILDSLVHEHGRLAVPQGH